MFLSKKMKRKMTGEDVKAIMERTKTEDPLELEKGDLKAMILAAIIVFLPFILVFSGTLFLLWWLLFNVLG